MQQTSSIAYLLQQKAHKDIPTIFRHMQQTSSIAYLLQQKAHKTGHKQRLPA